MSFDNRLRNVFKRVTEDIIDNLEKYTIKDKFRVINLLGKMMKVNMHLEQYDNADKVPDESDRDKKKYEGEVEESEEEEKKQKYWH
ncbi:MAG: hypothetical protein JEZ05_11030 [Tenericutes bacterium]|nr:hypothetical protein [Mycoplasmatota bacterium]